MGPSEPSEIEIGVESSSQCHSAGNEHPAGMNPLPSLVATHSSGNPEEPRATATAH